MLTPLIAFGVFVTVVLLFEGGYYFVHSRLRGARDEQRVKARLQSWAERPDLNKTPDLIVKETYSESPGFNALLAKLREQQYAARFAKVHDQAKAPYSL